MQSDDKAVGAPGSVARTEYLAHMDGRWIEYTLDSFQQRALGDDDAGGLIIGRDPQCDIVIDDDGIEDFHVRLFGYYHIECIAGHAEYGDRQGLAERGLAEQLYPGEARRYGGPASRPPHADRFAGWSESYFDEAQAPAALRAALSIARDAELEGRHAEADAIRVQAGYRKLRVPWRTQWPERLASSQQLVRIRVEEAGASVVHTVGSLDRMAEGITIGDAPSNDVVVASARANRIRLRGRQDLTVHVLEGHVRELSPDSVGERAGDFRPYRRWERFQLGDAVVQLCRWPRRGEALR